VRLRPFALPPAPLAPGAALRLGALLVLASASAPANPAPSRLTVSGSLRSRYESLDGEFRPGLGGSDQLLTFRGTIGAELRLAPMAVGAELMDSRAHLIKEDSSFGPGDTNALEPIQAYVRLEARSTQWTIGRFTQDLGSRRLVARTRSGNSAHAFTGVRGRWNGAHGDSLTGLVVMPMIRRPLSRTSAIGNAHEFDQQTWNYRLHGAFYTSRPFARQTAADVYLFHLNERDDATHATRDRRLTLFGTRLFRSPQPGALDFEVEGIWQAGRTRGSTRASDVRDLDIAAGYVHVEAGRTLEGSWQPRLELAYDYGTGDSDPDDGTHGRFDSLFGSQRIDLGPGSLYGALARSNISSPALRLEVVPSDRWNGYVSYRPVWLAQKRDAFGRSGVQDPTGRSGRFTGHQLEGRVRRRLGTYVEWELTAAWLLPRGFLQRAPNATRRGSTVYVYASVTYEFSAGG